MNTPKDSTGGCFSPPSSSVPVRGMYIGIPDLLSASMGIEDKVRSARYLVRDEANRITWVNDRLQDLTPNNYTTSK